LTAAGYRVETDLRSEKIGLKIRESELAKIPYMIILGKREVQGNKLSVRKRSGENIGELATTAFIEKLREEVTGVSG